MAVAPAIDLTDAQRRTVLALLSQYLPNTTVWAYGSRVKWTSHTASDLDLVVFAAPSQSARLAELREAFDESNLPFCVDLFVWDETPKDFRKRVEAERVVLAGGRVGKARRASQFGDPISDWRDVAIGDVADLVGGGTPSTKDPANFDGDIPWLTPKDLSGVHDRFVARGARNITELGIRRSSAKLVPAGSVLLTTRAPVGYVALAKNSIATNQGFRSLIPSEDMVPEFLYYWLLTNTAELERHATGSTFKELSGTELAKITLSLPPNSEQQKIVAVLGTLDDKIELNRRMAATLEDTVQVLFKSLFANAESSWPVKKLAEVSSTTKGRSYRSKELVEHSDTAMVTLKSFNRGGGYRPDGLKPFRGPFKCEQVVSPGDVVVACTDVTQDAEVVGRSALAQASRRFNMLVASLDLLILRPRNDLVSSVFLYGLTSSHDFVSHAKSYATGTTVLHMASSAVPSFEFPCPPKDRIAAFDRVAEPAMDRYGIALQESDRLTALRDTLLPRLISGEIRIPYAEKIVETAT